MTQLDVALLPDSGGIAQELIVPAKIIGGDAGDFAAQGGLVVRVIEIRPVGPVEPVEGRDRHQLDVLGHLLPGQRPQFAQAIGIGDDGGAGIEREALALPHVGAAAHFFAGFDQGRGDACALQADGEGEAAETGADNAGLLHVFLLFSNPRSASGRPPPARAATASPSGTGGLPARMRARSASVEFPA